MGNPYSATGGVTGRTSMGPLQPLDPAQLQRQAVVDQLGTAPPLAQPAMPGGPDPFARGGAVKPLPTAGVKGKLGDIGISTGASIAGQQIGRQAAQAALASGAQTATRSALTSGASGAAAGMGIGIGTGLLAAKLRTKEEMPTFGGSNSAYLDDLGRRFQGTGGGINSNAIKYAGMVANPALTGATMGLNIAGGAAYGAIKGAITKHAPSAYTDFRVEDAANAIKAQYKKELGREASDEEVMTHLKNQGWDGKSRWVGEKNLNSLMNNIRSTPEAQAFATRGAVVDQLGAPAPGAVPAGVDPATLRNATAPAPAGAAPTVDTTVPAGATRETPGGHGGVTGGADVLGGVGIVPADGAAPAAGAPDSTGWDTDGYAPPATTAPPGRFSLPGFEDDKLADPNIQHPKYVWGRIAAANMQNGKLDVPKAAEQLIAAYPGTTFDGKDKATIPGVGTIDLVRGASAGINAPTWQPVDDGGGSPAPQAADPTAIDAGRVWDEGTGSGDQMAKLKARLQEILAGSPNREALLSQMGTNG